MACSCCGEARPTASLRSRDDIQLCRSCLEWLLGEVGVTSTPTIPVVDMKEEIAFYEKADFGVRVYREGEGDAGDGFAFVDYEGESAFDLDRADIDSNRNGAGWYLITKDADAWHARMLANGLDVTTIDDQSPPACAGSRSRTRPAITFVSAAARTTDVRAIPPRPSAPVLQGSHRLTEATAPGCHCIFAGGSALRVNFHCSVGPIAGRWAAQTDRSDTTASAVGHPLDSNWIATRRLAEWSTVDFDLCWPGFARPVHAGRRIRQPCPDRVRRQRPIQPPGARGRGTASTYRTRCW